MSSSDPSLQQTLERRLVEFFDRDNHTAEGDDPWWAIAAKDQHPRPSQTEAEEPPAEQPSGPERSADDAAKAVGEPLRAVVKGPVAVVAAASISAPRPPATARNASPDGATHRFVPLEPRTLEETDIHDREIEALMLKYLHHCTISTGREIAEQLRLPFNLINQLLSRQKTERLVTYKASAPANDYVYELQPGGIDRMRRYAEQSTYFGAAPVSLRDYVRGMQAQSVTTQKPTLAQICAAFSDMTLSTEMIRQLGQAMHGGRGLFLYGSPGNGKTSIATRITRAMGEEMWIPRCISVFGEIVRLYDPGNHQLLPYPEESQMQSQHIDRRWVRICRPTMVVGGELTMDNLEITTNKATGISEAPLQMKSNGGTLVIDDFGRQRISTRELLNRWIIPLENGYDYVNLASGRKIQIPFDQMVVFSTNLEPRDLVDEAFLRRIPYKIDVSDPTEEEFRKLLHTTSAEMGLTLPAEVLDHLLHTHYEQASRNKRFCHARDLLRQVHNYCSFHAMPMIATRESVDAAVKNYFGMLKL